MNNIGQEVRLKENFECDLTLTITDLQPLLSNYSEDRRNAVEKPIPSIFLFHPDYKDNLLYLNTGKIRYLQYWLGNGST